MSKTRVKYYSLNNIKRKNATYNVIFGERSNGKTYAVLTEVVKNWVKDGSQFAGGKKIYGVDGRKPFSVL